jgi:hypothetical protein
MKCKFWKHCKLYSDHPNCTKTGGNAYGVLEFRGGGCYRNIEENGKESKYWKK